MGWLILLEIGVAVVAATLCGLLGGGWGVTAALALTLGGYYLGDWIAPILNSGLTPVVTGFITAGVALVFGLLGAFRVLGDLDFFDIFDIFD